MKIAFYCCSNGYGHFHRTLQICSYLKDMNIDIYCEKYQYNRFKDNISSFEFYRDKPKLNFIFYKSPNIRWDRKNNFSFSDYLKSIEESCANIDKYDLVITDNLVSILKYRPDAIYSGSFLWYDVFKQKFGDNQFTMYEEKLFFETKPLVVCNKYVTLGSLQQYDNKFEIGWGGEDCGVEEFDLDTLTFIVPSLNYTDDYIKKFLQIREQYKNEYNMSFNINHTKNSVFVVRPGLGIVNTCVSNRIPMVCLWSDNDSYEIKYLAQKIEKFGLGICHNVNDEINLDNIVNCRNNFKNQDIEGYKMFGKYLNEYNNR